MNPADQFEAFVAVIDQGKSVAEVAARFSVSEQLITQRLKLGRLSPAIMKAFREDVIDLAEHKPSRSATITPSRNACLQSLATTALPGASARLDFRTKCRQPTSACAASALTLKSLPRHLPP